MAAAPGAVAAANTVTLDGTGTLAGQTFHITADFDFSGTFKGDMKMTEVGGAPSDPDETLPYQLGTIVIGGQSYDLVGGRLNARSAAQDAAAVRMVDGRHWVRGEPDQDPVMVASGLRIDRMIGAAATAAPDSLEKALAGLLGSGLLVPDAASGAGGTFHYIGTLDEASLKTAKYTGAERDGVTDEMQTTIQAENVEVWLAPSGLPTEFKFSQTSINATYGDPPTSGDVHFTWGAPVTVAAPAASDVASQSDLNAAIVRGQAS